MRAMSCARRSCADIEMDTKVETSCPWMELPVQTGLGVAWVNVYPIAGLREHQVCGSYMVACDCIILKFVLNT